MGLYKSGPILELIIVRFYYVIVKVILTPMLYIVLVFGVYFMINHMFIVDPVYCAEDTTENIANTSKSIQNSTAQSNPTSSLTTQLSETDDGSTSKLVAKSVGAAAEKTVENGPWDKEIGGYTTSKVVSDISKSTPGRVKAASALTVGLTTGAFIYSQGKDPSAIMSNAPSSSSPDTNNPFIHCPLEEENNQFDFIDFIYKYLLQWMKSNSSDRLPSNMSIDVIDYGSTDTFFITFNLIVYIMYTVGYYFVFVSLILFMLQYFSKNIASSPKNILEVSSKTVESITWLISYTISISKTILIFLFTILLVCSTLLYINYNISPDLATHYNSILKELYNEPNSIIMKYEYLDIPVEVFLKMSITLIGFGIAVYRSSLMIKLLKGHYFIQLTLFLAIISFVKNISCYTMDITTMKNSTFIQMLTNYNMCSKLVFYSLVFILIFFVVLYIISIIKKNVPIFEFLLSDQEKVDHSNYNKYLVYNITIIVTKVIVSVAFAVAFQGILYLSTHYISGDLFSLFNSVL